MGAICLRTEGSSQWAREAGFEVLGMDGISVPFKNFGGFPPQEVYAFIKKQFLRYENAEGIYMLGSAWNTLRIVQILEQDLQVPVVHPTPARVWAVQKSLHVNQPVRGYGRLLEEMP